MAIQVTHKPAPKKKGANKTNTTKQKHTEVATAEDVKEVQRPVLKDTFLDVNNKYPASTMYVASDGDLVITGWIDKVKVIQVINNSKLSKEQLEATHEETTNTTTRTRTRSVSVAVSGDMTTLCRISYGYWRNILLKSGKTEGILKYVHDNQTEGGKTIYEGIIQCAKGKEKEATTLIKELIKGTKATVEWD